jgi:phage/plasmid-like protein (TIGR03299 family)
MTTKTNTATFFGLPIPETLNEAVMPLKGKTVKEWAKAAHLDWEYYGQPVQFEHGGKMRTMKDRAVLFRSDTGAPLSVVSTQFKVVQPVQMLELYKEVADAYGFDLALAGAIRSGQKIWALAQTPFTGKITKNDELKGCMFFSTACDLTTATQAHLNSFRLSCWNQLPVIDRHAQGSVVNRGRRLFRLRHTSRFEPKAIAATLDDMKKRWDHFVADMRVMAETKITETQALRFFAQVSPPPKDEDGNPIDVRELKSLEDLRGGSTIVKLMEVYENGEGQDNIKGTVYGALNAVTRYLDHETGARTQDARIRKAWMQSGVTLKQDAFDAALKLLPASVQKAKAKAA